MPSSDTVHFGMQSVEIFDDLKAPEDCMSAASSNADSSEHHDKSTDSTSEHGDGEISNDIADINIVDPNCVAEKPYRVTFQDITSAAFLIKSGIECTPCTVSFVDVFELGMGNGVMFEIKCDQILQKSRMSYKGMDIYLKKELLQDTGR